MEASFLITIVDDDEVVSKRLPFVAVEELEGLAGAGGGEVDVEDSSSPSPSPSMGIINFLLLIAE